MSKLVRLISVSKGIDDAFENAGGEEIISYVARVSNPSNQANFETAPKLLGYLIKHKHWSPFEHAFMTLEINTSRGIAAQILRHRSFVFQEFSQRYAETDSFIKYKARRQDLKNRQNSIDDMSQDDLCWFSNTQDDIWSYSERLYKEALKRGVAKEQARFLLPLNTKTTMYMTGSVRSWITYFMVRLDKTTQLEHREIALDCFKIFSTQYPKITEALKISHPELFNEVI
jgi:thymidylate synthase (FAD)